eukprot:TRINITY_DN22648_c0_g1_i1.p2 TRINITY_DN22648_c0_g1~~TRINITY_DN22648_c0_g1_i1.p2  ORF type:complete len:105 (-),score=31.32 TRINITY_DN22648_c0_g1_i1:4-279(-)
MKKKTPVFPETVADEVRLWEAERNRVTFDEGTLFDFGKENSVDQWDKVVKYAKDIGVLVYVNEKKKLLFVNKIGGADITKFWERNFKNLEK